MSATNAKKLAVVFELKPAEIAKLTKDDNPGLSLIEKLEEMSIISKENIDELLEAMDEVNLQAFASEVREDFSRINRGKVNY